MQVPSVTEKEDYYFSLSPKYSLTSNATTSRAREEHVTLLTEETVSSQAPDSDVRHDYKFLSERSTN